MAERGKFARAGKEVVGFNESLECAWEEGSDGLGQSLCRRKCACGRGRDGIGESLCSHPTLKSLFCDQACVQKVAKVRV